MPKHLPIIAACLLLLCAPALAGDEQRKDDQGRDYWLYTPDNIDPEKEYTLVLGVHGYRGNGKGAGGYAGWATSKDVIVLGPSYDSNGYQYLQAGADEQTIALLKTLHKEFNLKDKIFVGGFSGGSQFAHRFAMKYPNLVAGCAAHSGGTWATGDYAERAMPNPAARGVLFVISCGENDTKKSFSDAPMGRLEWAKKYEQMLDKGGFIYHAKWIPNVGHSYSRGARQMTEDCFHASTNLLPAFEEEHDEIKKLIRKKQHGEAWALIQARLTERAEAEEGIITKVIDLYLDEISSEIGKIDRWGERKAQKAARIEDEAERNAEINKLKAMFTDKELTPRACDAIDDAASE